MLNSTTKNRINSCRDMLVGKLPDPKSQIDQITNALVYKFMDDQDRMSRELGYDASFFIGDYEQYAWSKLFDNRLTNQEKANLYSEGLDKLSVADHLPELFKQIFKNARLPFKDPSTITMFLAEINGFSYHHSEELGNAFEYLLSVMGSQGDTGSFRTPRHIIEFLVDVVDPKRGETIYDPACGTAGFLIEAFNHIKSAGDLSVSDTATLGKNISGVDIDPGMAKIARVNLYLHGFKTPNIDENDTLSNEKLWGMKRDVILANPPFMTPKGGIRPHEKFSSKTSKSEVLFTDYIIEHLKLHGRAGIIVPEGIMFNGSNAYKDLRKKLVDGGYLWAVASLPSGVFNPYAGVKTSILFLDRERAKANDSILFVKISADGYDLGAQRREINKNDLPKALEILNAYKENPAIDLENEPLAHLVPKSKISENGEYNLSGDRYAIVSNPVSTEYQMVQIQEVVNTVSPSKKIQKSDFLSSGLIPIIDQSQEFISGFTNDVDAKIINSKPLVVFGDHTCAVKYIDFPFAQGADGIKILETKENLNPKYLYYNLFYRPLKSDGYQRHFSKLKEYQIPLPPIEIQEQIVAELDGYQRIIDGARAVVENYKPMIKIDPEWEMVELGEIARVINGKAYKQEELLSSGKYPVLRVGNFFSNRDWYYSDLELDSDKYCDYGDLLYAWSASFGPRIWKGGKTIYHYHIWKIVPSELIDRVFLSHILEKETENLKSEGGRGIAMMHLTKENFEKKKIPLPPLEIQQSIVEQIEEEQRLVDANRRLIEIYEGKIREKMDEVWGVK